MARSSACCRRSCRCSSRARRTWAWRRTTSSSRSATTCGPGYKTGEGIERALVGAVPSARGSARRDGRRRVADDRARGGRRARVGRQDRRGRRDGGQGVDLDRRQGSRPMRARRSRRAGRPAREEDLRRSGRAREVRRAAGADPRLSGARRGRRRRLSGHRGHRRGVRRAHAEPIRRDRDVSTGRCWASDSEAALLFKKLATLRDDAPLFRDVEELRWQGPKASFASWAGKMDADNLVARCEKIAGQR